MKLVLGDSCKGWPCFPAHADGAVRELALFHAIFRVGVLFGLPYRNRRPAPVSRVRRCGANESYTLPPPLTLIESPVT